MAHACPKCYQTCYCGGDIGDCICDDTLEAFACTHCPIDGYDPDDDDYPEDEEAPDAK